MQDPDTEALIEHLFDELQLNRAGDVGTGRAVSCLVVAALLTSMTDDLLREALRFANATGDRQFVAIADAYLGGDHDRVDVLARDHLLDHPPRPVLSWIVARSPSADERPSSSPT